LRHRKAVRLNRPEPQGRPYEKNRQKNEAGNGCKNNPHINTAGHPCPLYFIVRKACTSSGSFGKPAYQQDEGGGNGKQKNNVGNVET